MSSTNPPAAPPAPRDYGLHVRQLVDSAPALSPDQRDRLAVLLRRAAS